MGQRKEADSTVSSKPVCLNRPPLKANRDAPIFKVLSTRKRKDAAESEIKVQVAVFAFDLLYLNGEALVTKPFQERRSQLKSHFKEVEGEFLFAKSADPDTMEHVQELLEDSVKGESYLTHTYSFTKKISGRLLTTN